jgi:predicted amidohydrolase YtcJ/pimeloyl-ACP methyl ester carboxylesterase
MRTRLFGAIIAIGFSAYSIAQAQPSALAPETILKNGKIWTVNPAQPEVQALAIRGDRIVALGSDVDIAKLAGPKTVVIDLQGQRVVPGFHDSHVHVMNGGFQLGRVKLKDAADEAEFGQRLRAAADKLPRDRWLTGNDWDHDRAFAGNLPTAALLDKYVADRHVFLRRYDGHMGVANSLALQQANITASTNDPVGGVIVRDPATKRPTGLLRDTAMSLVEEFIPPPTEEEIRAALLAALVEIRKNGITSVQDMAGAAPGTRQKMLRAYQQLKNAGLLTCRVRFHWPLAEWQALAKLGVQMGLGDLWLEIGVLKDFIDGSLGSSTAKMFEPYLNEPTSTGIYVRPRLQLLKDVVAADQAGLGVAIHAIGDRGNAELLDIFAEAIKTNGPRDRRFRIEHAQHLRPGDYGRFAELGVIASIQPFHLIDDGRWAEGRIGKERCASSYANASLLKAGAKVAFGSDWPVAPLSPLLGIDAAVNRRTLDGKNPGGWFPEQKITVAQALESYTRTAAFAAFREKECGSLEVGKLADLVVLSRDILLPAERDAIASTEVLLTLAGGRVVFEKSIKETVRAADGVGIVCEVRGHGETTLVFLHGWCGSREHWKHQVGAFATDYRVVALDLAGHGGSGKDRKAWTVEGLARDVESVVKALGLKRVILVGHSMGGPVALAAAGRMRGTVIAVVGVDTLHDAEFRRDEAATKKFLEPFEKDFKGAIRTGLPGAFHEKSDADVTKWVVAQVEAHDPGMAIALMRDHSGLDRKTLFKEAGAPVRCINSAAGFPHFKPTATATNKRYADFDAVALEGVGHYPMLENPAAFNKQLRDVLKEFQVRK